MFFNFTRKSCPGDYFSGAFNASYLHQIWQHHNQNDRLTFLYNQVWSVEIDWQHNDCDAGLKWQTQAAFNWQIWQFMVLLWTNGWDPS